VMKENETKIYFIVLSHFFPFFFQNKITSPCQSDDYNDAGVIRADGCRKRNVRKPRWTSSTTWTPKWRTTRDSTNFRNPISTGRLTQPWVHSLIIHTDDLLFYPSTFSAILTFLNYLIIHRISVWWMELIFILFFRSFVGSYVGGTIRKPRRN
jgi:hypothetical protein